MHDDFSPEVTAVLDGVRDLLPTFRERAEEGDRLRVGAGHEEYAQIDEDKVDQEKIVKQKR